MKKFVPQKIASRTNTKKKYFRNIKTKIKDLVLPRIVSKPTTYYQPKNCRCIFQRCQNWRNIQKPRPEASGNYQFVTTTFLGQKLPQHKSASATSLTQWNWWLEQQWTHQDFLTSHTLSWKMKKFVPQKIASRTNTKKDIFQKYKDQNQKLSFPMNFQQTDNVLTNQKNCRCLFQRCQNWRNIQ